MTQTNVTQVTIKASSKPDADRILRRLSEGESFYFYRTIGEPTGDKASSLIEFAQKLETVDPLSIAFHYYRRDFARWIRQTVGDSALAAQLTVQGKSALKGEALRNLVQQKVKARLSQLKK